MTTTDLPSGPELDLAVAKACGIEVREEGNGILYRPGNPWYKRWEPSSPAGIADAFEALEAMVGEHRFCNLERYNGKWNCTIMNYYEEADTPTLAICRALVAAGKGEGGK